MKWHERRTQLRLSTAETDTDITRFGEELERLDVEVADSRVDEAMQQDYQRALDAYEDAKVGLKAVKKPDGIRSVTGILEDGRYAVACVRARLHDEPLPVRRPPCFFDPAHGPSTQDLDWAPSGGTTRSVPVCAADAVRLQSGAEPAIRTVRKGSGRVPYWQAGPAYAPWALGYYGYWGGSDLLSGVLIGSALSGGFGDVSAGSIDAGTNGDIGGAGDAGGAGDFGDGGGLDDGFGFFDGF